MPSHVKVLHASLLPRTKSNEPVKPMDASHQCDWLMGRQALLGFFHQEPDALDDHRWLVAMGAPPSGKRTTGGGLGLSMLNGELTVENLAYSLPRHCGVLVSTYQVVLSYEGDHQDCVADNLTHDEAVKVFKESIEKLKGSEEAEFIEIWEMDDDDNMVDTVMEHSFE